MMLTDQFQAMREVSEAIAWDIQCLKDALSQCELSEVDLTADIAATLKCAVRLTKLSDFIVISLAG